MSYKIKNISGMNWLIFFLVAPNTTKTIAWMCHKIVLATLTDVKKQNKKQTNMQNNNNNKFIGHTV